MLYSGTNCDGNGVLAITSAACNPVGIVPEDWLVQGTPKDGLILQYSIGSSVCGSSAPGGYLYWYPEGECLLWNPQSRLYRRFGCSPDSSIGKYSYQVFKYSNCTGEMTEMSPVNTDNGKCKVSNVGSTGFPYENAVATTCVPRTRQYGMWKPRGTHQCVNACVAA